MRRGLGNHACQLVKWWHFCASAEFFGDCGETPAFGLDDYVIQVQWFCLPEILKCDSWQKMLRKYTNRSSWTSARVFTQLRCAFPLSCDQSQSTFGHLGQFFPLLMPGACRRSSGWAERHTEIRTSQTCTNVATQNRYINIMEYGSNFN